MRDPEGDSRLRQPNLMGASSIADEIWKRMKAWVDLRLRDQHMLPASVNV
jgi:hypothetical protein